MKYLYVLFIRNEPHGIQNQRRGYIAGKPVAKFPAYVDPFIVCKIDPSILTESMLIDDTIMLNFTKLQKANTVKQVEDENGDWSTVTVYDYYDVQGRSSEVDCPLIDLSDVLRGE